MLVCGLLHSLCKVTYFIHCHLREILVEYLAGLCLDNCIGLELIIKGVGNSPRHYLTCEIPRIEKEKKNWRFVVYCYSVPYTYLNINGTLKTGTGSLKDLNKKRSRNTKINRWICSFNLFQILVRTLKLKSYRCDGVESVLIDPALKYQANCY